MMSTRRVGLAFAACLALLACESDIVIGPSGIDSVTLDQTVISLLVGEGIQLNAAARDENGIAFTGQAVGWVSSNPAVARVSSTGLVAAVGVGTATITASVEGLTASTSVLVTPAAAIGVSSSVVSFSAVIGEADPAPQTISVFNDGGGTINAMGTGVIVYNTGEPTGWLSAGLNAALDSLVIRTTAGSLAAGTYQARIPLVTDDAGNSPFNVLVTLNVSEAVPSLQLSSTFASFSAFGGGLDPAPIDIQVTNAGTGNLSGLAVGTVDYAPGQPTGWLGVSVAGTTVTLQATTGSLLAGNYLATVPVTAPNADNNPQVIVVGFSVSPTGPAIGVLSDSVNMSGAENGPNPAPDTVGVVNLGSGVLDQLTVGTITYGAGQPTGWLSGNLIGTTAPTSVALSANTAGMPAGAFQATVPIESPVATNSPVNITVSLVLSGSDSIRFDPASGQAAAAGTPVSPNPIVIVVDATGNPVAGREVSFVASGSGSVSQAVDTTNASGQASITWTLGTVAATDSDTLTASLPGGLATTLVATASPGMATALAVATEPSGAVSQTVFTVQPAVQLTDQFGNAVAQNGVTVTASRAVGAGTLSGTLSANTDASGIATFTDLAFTDTDSVTALGQHQLQFTSGTLTAASSANFNVDVSFARNIQLVVQTLDGAAPLTCSNGACHGTSFSSQANLVGQPTTFNPGCGTLVVASDTAASIFYQKVIAGGDWCGASRMPLGGDTLSTVRQNLIRDWILQGAAAN